MKLITVDVACLMEYHTSPNYVLIIYEVLAKNDQIQVCFS